jgi:hypothetical protein
MDELGSPGTWVARGLNAEVTLLEVGGAPWWTLGFEAFPGDVEVEREFVPAVRAMLRGFPGFGASRVSGPVSCGYPAWLRRAWG